MAYERDLGFDPSGPRPIYYHQAQEWDKIRNGRNHNVPGQPYEPIEYHARMNLHKKYKDLHDKYW